MQLPTPDLCTGCSACTQVCPNGALQMRPDEEGFLQPVVNESECCNCEKCARVCPVLHMNTQPKKLIGFFAAYARDVDIRKRSSSGGIFSVLARRLLRDGGVVFGAVWDSGLMRVRHIAVMDEENLPKLAGSKYVQSDITECLPEVRRLLEENRRVMFSGTPCQLAGLKAFLGREYENLFMAEIVCHGVPSPLVLMNYLDEITSSQICNVQFRDKSRGWHEFSLRVVYKEGQEFSESIKENIFLRGFLSNLYLRKSCYRCRTENKLIGDVVLADFWNIKSEGIFEDDDLGVSAVFATSEKGNQAINNLEDEIVCEKVSPKRFFESNRNVLLPSYRHPNRDVFFAAMAKGDLAVSELIIKHLKWARISKIKWKIKRHFQKKKMRSISNQLEQGRYL